MNYQFLPKFKIVEINNMAALRMGHIIAQNKAAAEIACVSFNNNAGVACKFLENGIIVGLGSDGLVANYDPAKHAQPMLVFNEELISGPLYSLDQYAEPIVNGVVYPRCLPLYLGDTFTTNNVADGVFEDGFAKVVNGVVVYQETADESTMFIAKKANLPAGQAALELQYYKPAAVVEG